MVERQQFRDGSIREIQTRKFPVRDEEGNIVGVLGMFEDLSAHQRAEANELVQNMSRRITHALGSWIEALQLNVKLLAEKSGESRPIQRLNQGLTYLESLLDIMTGVATLTRDDFQSIDLLHLIEQTAELNQDARIEIIRPSKPLASVCR